jgi:hypothetical protein
MPASASSSCRARPTGRKCPQVNNAARAKVSGPIRTGEPCPATTSRRTSSGGTWSQPGVVTAPQHAQTFDTRWYSVTSGTRTGPTSTTCRRSRPATGASTSEDAHPPQHSGSSTTISSGSSINERDDEDAPGCLPGLRPDRPRDERFLAGFLSHGTSEDGGRDEFDES